MRDRAVITTRSIGSVLTFTAAVFGGAVAPSAFGQCDSNQTFKLLADDGAEPDQFGQSVAISGTVAISGAGRDADNGENSGSAYLFDTVTGQQLVKLLPNDGGAWDLFGDSVGISGTTAIVGATRDTDNGFLSGSAYLFDTVTGNQLFKLLPTDGDSGDHFGKSVGISGTTAIVGAFQDNPNGRWSGSAYLFDTVTGQQIFKLVPNDGAESDAFGLSVAIGGPLAIVGSSFDDDNGSKSGSAYLFDVATGQQIAKLLPTDGAANNRFGISVGLSDDGAIAIVGAFWDDDNGENSGSAYLFDTATGQQIAKLLPTDGSAGDFFGLSAAVSGGIAIVGAHQDSDNGENSGSAYFFDATTGQQVAKLLPHDGAEGDLFGNRVAISGDTAIVGSHWDDDNGRSSGSAYLFQIKCRPTLTVTPEPLVAGQAGVFTAVNLTPNDATYLAYSLRGLGSTYVAPLNVTLDLAAPKQAGRTIRADDAGVAEWTLPIPGSAVGRNVWFQTCQFELKTDVVATSIED